MAKALFSACLLLASFVAPVFSQTSTDCQPLTESCPSDPALSGNYTLNFNDTINENLFESLNNDLSDNKDGLGKDFVISKKGEGPTIRSKFYIFFGHVEVLMKAAEGNGIISTVVLMSDDLDEIDWEFIGNEPNSVETDYFGKGNDTLSNRELTVPVDDSFGKFHNLTWDWTHERIEWWVDGNLTRTLKYEDALGGKNYPQTPARVSVGMWAGGDSKNLGTIEWAGGKTDYSKAPFTMTVQSLYIKDYSEGKEYTYSDHSGDWQSIEVEKGTSDAVEEIKKTPAKSASQKFHDLSKGAKAGIFIAVAVVGASVVGGIIACCVIQKKRGRKEYMLAQTAYAGNAAQSTQFREQWQQRHQSAQYQQVAKDEAS